MVEEEEEEGVHEVEALEGPADALGALGDDHALVGLRVRRLPDAAVRREGGRADAEGEAAEVGAEVAHELLVRP